MKSTKNILMTGVALAIALFASVQVAAMENEQVNPSLTKSELKYALRGLQYTKERIKMFDNPKSEYYNPERAEREKKLLEQQEDVVYGPSKFSYLDFDMLK